MDETQLTRVMDKLATTLGDKLSTTPSKPKEVSPDKLDTLDSIKWMTFRSNFEKVASLNKWENDRSVPMLQTCLTDAAARATEHLVFNDQTTLTEALDRMEQIFVNPAATDYYEMTFDLADKEPGESLVTLHTRYRELFLRAFPQEKATVDTSKKLKDKFALKIGDKGLSYGLTSATDYKRLTYSALLTRAQELQASALRCRQSYNPGAASSKQQVLAISQDRPKLRLSDRRCYFCNNVGHVVKDCRKKAAFLRDNPDLRPAPGRLPPHGNPGRGRPRGGRGGSRPRGRGDRQNQSYRFQNPKRSINALNETEDQSHSSAEHTPEPDPMGQAVSALYGTDDDSGIFPASLYEDPGN